MLSVEDAPSTLVAMNTRNYYVLDSHMMTEKVVTGGAQHSPDVHLSSFSCVLHQRGPESIAVEPSTPQDGDGVPPGDNAISAVTPTVPEVEDTIDQVI